MRNAETIRLIYPQWQGGNITSLIPELKLLSTENSK